MDDPYYFIGRYKRLSELMAESIRALADPESTDPFTDYQLNRLVNLADNLDELNDEYESSRSKKGGNHDS